MQKLKKLKTIISVLIIFGFISGTYFAVKAYTPGDTTGVKKVMPPPYSDPALVGYWSMDDNAASTAVADSSGNGNNGTAQANTDTKTTTDAVHNRALSFNGTSDYVTTVDAPFDFGTGNFSCSAWIKATALPGSKYSILSKVQSIPYPGWALELLPTGNIRFIASDAYDRYFQTSNASISATNWYHIVGIKNDTSLKVYVNGIDQAGSDTGSGNENVDSTGNLYISREAGVASYYFNGSIDDVRIYNKALTASDVYSLYQAGRPRTQGGGFSKMLFPPIDQSVVGWWKLNDAAGQTVVKDWTSNGNTGTSANNITSATGYTAMPNTAMSFNGSGDKIAISDSASLKPSNYITVSGWFKSAGAQPSYVGLVSKLSSSNYNGYALKDAVSGNMQFWVQIGGANETVQDTSFLVTGVWTFITGVYDGSSLILYRNGNSVNSIPASGTINHGTQGLYIGDLYGSGDYDFNGSISDVRIFSRALSANEVKVLYMRGR